MGEALVLAGTGLFGVVLLIAGVWLMAGPVWAGAAMVPMGLLLLAGLGAYVKEDMKSG